MCIITATVASAVTAIATAVTVATSTAMSLSQASMQKKTTAYQIEQKRKEAKNLELQAAYERQEGIENARQQKINAILNMKNEKAKLAGHNIAMSSGLVLNLENDSKLNSELDALTTQKSSEIKADNLLAKRNNLYEQAGLMSFNNKINNYNFKSKNINTYTQLGSKITSFTG